MITHIPYLAILPCQNAPLANRFTTVPGTHEPTVTLTSSCTQIHTTRTSYSDTSSALHLASFLSEEFTTETGMKQGCVIAPDPFNCVIDHLMRCLLHRCRFGYSLVNASSPIMRMTLPCLPHLPACLDQEALEILQEEANLVGMKISCRKNKHPGPPPPTTPTICHAMRMYAYSLWIPSPILDP